MLGQAMLRLEPTHFLTWFVRLRWFAAVCAGLVVGFAQVVLQLDLPYAALWAVVGAIPLYNVVLHALLRGRAPDSLRPTDPAKMRSSSDCALALAQINLDLLALFVLLHLSGGIENPFVLFFLFHVVISAILLPARLAMLEALVASALVFALGALEASGALSHYHLTVLGSSDPTHGWGYVLPVAGVLSTSFLVVMALTLYIMREVHKRTGQIFALTRSLEKRNRALHRIDRMRKRLLAVASHDLKAPTAAVSSYLMMLKDGFLGPVTEQQRDVIARSLGRLDGLRSLVNDILDVTSVERGELQQKMTSVDLARQLRAVVEQHRPVAEAKDVRVDWSVPDDLPEVTAAKARMGQVFDNLLSNAVKYTPAGGSVSVSARKEGEQLCFTVKDTGIGMSDEEQERLFEEFYRTPTAKESGIEGTGLGLHLARLIVRTHGGHIHVQSAPGEGSCFEVCLPLRAPDPRSVTLSDDDLPQGAPEVSR